MQPYSAAPDVGPLLGGVPGVAIVIMPVLIPSGPFVRWGLWGALGTLV